MNTTCIDCRLENLHLHPQAQANLEHRRERAEISEADWETKPVEVRERQCNACGATRKWWWFK